MQNHPSYHLLEKYISGTLSEDETLELENAFMADPELKQYFENQKIAENMLIDSIVADWGETVKTDLDDYGNSNKYWKWVVLSAIFIATVSATIWIVSENKPQSESLPSPVQEIKTIANNQSQNAVQEIKGSETESPQPTAIKTTEPIKPDNIPIKETAPVPSAEEKGKDEKTYPLIEELPQRAEIENDHRIEKDDIKEGNKNISEKISTVDRCKDIFKNISIDVEQPTVVTLEGAIEIDNLPESTEIALNSKDEYTNETIFYNLSPGEYKVFAKSENGCEALIKIIKLEIDPCLIEYPETFKPATEEEWKIPSVDEMKCEIKIISLNREIVYTSSNDGTGNIYWDGTDKEGNTVLPALYKTIITYENGKTCIHDISVIP